MFLITSFNVSKRSPLLIPEIVLPSILALAICNDYKINGRKSLDKIEQRLSHLRKAFGNDKMINVTTDRVNKYIEARFEQKAANATMNRELACLKRMFNLGIQSGTLTYKPSIKLLTENNTRTGFFEYNDFKIVRDELPEYLKPMVTFAYFTGWRSGEIRSLTWKNVDLNQKIIRLEVGTTKNRDGRVIFIPKPVFELLNTLWKSRRLDCPWIFHRNGKQPAKQLALKICSCMIFGGQAFET